jgi:phage shock protein C
MAEVRDPRPGLRRGGDRMLGGVCSGLAEHFGVDVLLVRLAFVALALFHGLGVLAYLVLWVLVPDRAGAGGFDLGAAVAGVRSDLSRVGDDVGRAFGRRDAAPARPAPPAEASREEEAQPAPRRDRGVLLGAVLVLLGAWMLGSNLGLLGWWDWSLAGPVALILLGLVMLGRRLR